jgi:hypothetical protein
MKFTKVFQLDNGEIAAYITDDWNGYYNIVNRTFENINFPYIIDINKKDIWIVVSELCRRIHMTNDQIKSQLKLVKRDLCLSKQAKMLKVKNGRSYQKTLCIDYKAFEIWMCKINHKTINDETYRIVMSVINKSSKSNFSLNKEITQTFITENDLKNCIYDNHFVNEIEVIGKEVIYNFGRIDLLGTDKQGNKICIELKKDNKFNDTKEQLLRYKNSNVFDKILYIAYNIENDFKIWLVENNIDYLVYKRNLVTGEIEYSSEYNA